MGLASIKHWQWLAMSVIVGLVCGAIRRAQLDFADDLPTFGTVIASSRDFEKALVTSTQGKPHFKNVVVYPYELRDARSGAQRVYVVAGEYFDGHVETSADGRPMLEWRPACYVASSPYRSAPQADGSTRQFDTILAYLRGSGVPYRFAWWWPYRPFLIWTGGSVLVIGTIWPLLLNLMLYGSLRAPRREEAVRISGSSRPPSIQPASPPILAIGERDDKDLLVPVVAAEPATSSATPLSTAPLDPAAPVESAPREFGADKDDFYPTERHHRTPSEPH
jgi:hypothetical protein